MILLDQAAPSKPPNNNPCVGASADGEFGLCRAPTMRATKCE
jgi:hypothetical protein